MKIEKEIKLFLTQKEIDSPLPIVIKLHVSEEGDPDNEEGVTYTITYPKTSKQN